MSRQELSDNAEVHGTIGKAQKILTMARARHLPDPPPSKKHGWSSISAAWHDGPDRSGQLGRDYACWLKKFHPGPCLASSPIKGSPPNIRRRIPINGQGILRYSPARPLWSRLSPWCFAYTIFANGPNQWSRFPPRPARSKGKTRTEKGKAGEKGRTRVEATIESCQGQSRLWMKQRHTHRATSPMPWEVLPQT